MRSRFENAAKPCVNGPSAIVPSTGLSPTCDRIHAMPVVTRVESRKGARPGPTGSRWFPFPAHQTGRARFEHPAFRQTSSVSFRFAEFSYASGNTVGRYVSANACAACNLREMRERGSHYCVPARRERRGRFGRRFPSDPGPKRWTVSGVRHAGTLEFDPLFGPLAYGQRRAWEKEIGRAHV